MAHDVFISYATEDEEAFVAPLAAILTKLGVNVWFAPAILKVGDSLSRSIDKGLANSSFGVVVLSKSFMAKHWPEYELRGLISKAVGKKRSILPIWLNISRDDVLAFSPPLADTIALDSSKRNLDEIAVRILEIVRPDIFNHFLRLQTWKDMRKTGKTERIPIASIKIPQHIHHQTLPDSLLIRIKVINQVLYDVLPIPLEETIDNFRREFHPVEEIIYWERIVAAYLDATSGKKLTKGRRREIVAALLRWSTGNLDDSDMQYFKHLGPEEVLEIGTLYLRVIPKLTERAVDPEQ